MLVAVSAQAGEGQLRTLDGDPLVASVPRAIEKNILAAIFPAAALHVQPREQQFAQWEHRHVLWGYDFGSVP